MKKIALVVIALLVLAAGAFFLMMPPPVDLEPYQALKTPRITSKPDQRVLEVTAKGDPDESAPKAIGLLYSTFMGLDGAREMVPVAPKARWPIEFGIPRTDYVGQFALPAPESLTAAPDAEEDDLKVELVTWAYGEVAEILHIGDYDDEMPTIEKLHAFIKAQGYVIAGHHEEEYLKGPGMFSKGNPAEYQTVIRYNVRPAPKEEVDNGSPEDTEANDGADNDSAEE